MKYNLPFMALIVLACAYIPACDRACDKSVTTTAKIDNLTGRDLNVTIGVCNLGALQKQKVILNSAQQGAFAIESHKEKWITTGGPANSCAPVNRDVGVYLTDESFDQVKLCQTSRAKTKNNTPADGSGTTAQPAPTIANNQVSIVELDQDCPEGQVEQMNPVTNCVLN